MGRPCRPAAGEERNPTLRKAEAGSRRAVVAIVLALALLAATLAACGGDDDDGGPAELTWFIFNEPSGVLPTIAKRCSEESNGEYTIKFEYLPSDADQQREQLVRRLGAEDDSIDIIGMDVIWTGEFANAGWVEEWTGEDQKAATENVFPSVAESARFEEKLWAPRSGRTRSCSGTARTACRQPRRPGTRCSSRPRSSARGEPDRDAGQPLRGPRRLVQRDGRVGGHLHRRARRRGHRRARVRGDRRPP